MILLRKLYDAVAHPQPDGFSRSLWRHFLLKRRIFDLISILVQIRDFQRLKKINVGQSLKDDHFQHAYDYNLSVFLKKGITKTRRMESFYKIWALPPRDMRDEKILIVGPRNIVELYVAWLYGCRWKNIHAIDLYSSNPKIEVMNMEKMSFEDETYDAVMMTQTFSYAKDASQCLSEVCRVLKPGGVFIFNANYAPESDWATNKIPGQELQAMLRELGFNLTYYHAFDKTNALGHIQTTHVFSVKKINRDKTLRDPIQW